MTQAIDRDSWPRRELFDFFSRMSQPFYSVTFRQDVTGLYQFAKKHRLSFYYSLVYLCTQAVNEVENFRYGLEGGAVVLYDRRVPSFTDLHPGSGEFHIVSPPWKETLQDFCAAAREQSRAQTTLLGGEDARNMIFFSCLPWVEVTAVTNERDFDPDDSVPRIIWGKYREEQGRKTLHISLELNHRLVDGLHVGRFHEALSALIEALPS